MFRMQRNGEMYNQRLNEAWRQMLANSVEGKRVLLVGNSVSMFSSVKFGELIDNYDFVVRFGKGVPYTEFKEYLGIRTDLWFFGTGRAGMWPQFKHVPYKMFTPSQIPLYDSRKTELGIHRDMLNGKLQIYRDYFMAGSAETLLAANKEINGDSIGSRLSQGAQCAHYFSNFVDTYASLDFVGFDFFVDGFTYNYESKNKQIPKVQPTTSWHCPLQSKGFDTNPHDYNGNEQRYIRSIPRSSIHEMPPHDPEVMRQVLLRLRGPNAIIQE